MIVMCDPMKFKGVHACLTQRKDVARRTSLLDRSVEQRAAAGAASFAAVRGNLSTLLHDLSVGTVEI